MKYSLEIFMVGLICLMFLITIQNKPLQMSKPDRFIDTIIVHHSGGKNIDVSAEQIRVYHMTQESKGGPKKGPWRDIGYHYVIRRTGRIEMGRNLSKIGAHAGWQRNKSSLGICLSGNTATRKQLKTLHKLCNRLYEVIPEIEQIERHREECPGPSVNVEKLEQDIIGGE